MGRKLTAAGLVRKFHVACRERDRKIDPLCRICRKRPIECAYHVVPGHYGLAVKWNPENVVGACMVCNHQEILYRDEYHEKHKVLFADRFERIWESRHKILKLSRADKLDIIAKIEQGS